MLSTSRAGKAGGSVRDPSVLEFSCPAMTALSQGSSIRNLSEKSSAVGSTKQDLVQQSYYKQLPPSVLQVTCSLPSLMSTGKQPIFTGNSQQSASLRPRHFAEEDVIWEPTCFFSNKAFQNFAFYFYFIWASNSSVRSRRIS